MPWCISDAALFRMGPLAAGVAYTAVMIRAESNRDYFADVLPPTRALHATLHAAHALHVPGVLVLLCSLAYRYSFLLADELARTRIALRVRGYRNRANLHSYRTVGHVTGMLLVRGHERGERVSHAMLCRGFDGQFRSMAEFRTTAADVLLFSAVAAACLVLVFGETLRGRLM